MGVFVVCLLFSGFHAVVYASFASCFGDDLYLEYGKNTYKNLRRSKQTFVQKLFFLNMRKMVKPFHYICFCIHFAMFFPCLGLAIAGVLVTPLPLPLRITFGIMFVFYIFPYLVACFAHFGLNRRWNKYATVNRKKYKLEYKKSKRNKK